MSDTCKHGMEVCEPCAEERGRQAQYKLMRAGNCKNGLPPIDGEHFDCELLECEPCPTDYRKCPLTKEGEK